MIEVTNSFDWLCNVCIDLMIRASEYSGLSYGVINILLFVILGPLSTILFCMSSIIGRTMANGKNLKRKKILWLIVFCLGCAAVVCVLAFIAYTLFMIPIDEITKIRCEPGNQ